MTVTTQVMTRQCDGWVIPTHHSDWTTAEALMCSVAHLSLPSAATHPL